jgi:hypothetical protein
MCLISVEGNDADAPSALVVGTVSVVGRVVAACCGVVAAPDWHPARNNATIRIKLPIKSFIVTFPFSITKSTALSVAFNRLDIGDD